MGKANISALIRQAGGVCHYCKRQTKKRIGSNLYPTRDHVVPKSFGGANHIDNYVLACLDCNNKRGTSLFYCKCRDCKEKIYDALYDPSAVEPIFNGMMSHNKPRVYRWSPHETNQFTPKWNWQVRIGHNKKNFFTFDEAIAFALTKTFAEDKNYE